MKIMCYDDVFRAYVSGPLLALFYTQDNNNMLLAYLLASDEERKMLIYLYHTDQYSENVRVTRICAAYNFLNHSKENLGCRLTSRASIWHRIVESIEAGELSHNQEVLDFLGKRRRR